MVKSAFLPLPVGSVEPAGWIRDWAVAARQGITGHLDEYHSVYHDAWKGPGVKGTFAWDPTAPAGRWNSAPIGSTVRSGWA